MNMVLTIALFLLTVSVAALPSFGLLYLLRTMLPEHPESLLSVFSFIVQTTLVWFGGFFVMFFYADLVFPMVMKTFGVIFNLQKEKI